MERRNRRMYAINSVADGQSRRLHVDLQALGFGTEDREEAHYPQTQTYIVSKLRDTERKAEFEKELAKHSLNESQLSAVRRTFESNNGAHVVWGSSGTGKTKVLVAAVSAAAKAGFRILVTGASIEGVKLLAKRFADVTSLASSEWVVFSNDAPAVQPQHQSGDMPNSMRGYENMLFDVGLQTRNTEISVDKSFRYADRLVLWVEELEAAGSYDLDEDGKIMYQKAVQFLALLKHHLSNSAAGNGSSEEDTAKLYRLSEYLSACYLNKRAKVILVENEMSCNEALQAYFDPTMHFMDDAHLAQAADSMIPWAVFKNNLANIMLTGDFKQGKPAVLSQGTNEFAHILEESLLQKLWEDPRMESNRSVLREQYRMPAYLSTFARENIYERGHLVDADAVKGTTELQTLLSGLFKPLKNEVVWNGNPRMGIDCFGLSEKNEAGSIFNVKEARTVALLLVSLTMVAGIDPSKILVTSPYRGQLGVIRQILDGGPDPRPAQVKIEHPSEIRGDEFNIVILSLARSVKDDPNSLDWVATNRELFTVQITRAKDFMFVLGNFKALMEVYENGETEEGAFLWKEHELFRKFMVDCLEKNDVLSADDFEEVIVREKSVEAPVFGEHTALAVKAASEKRKNVGGASLGGKSKDSGAGSPEDIDANTAKMGKMKLEDSST